MQNHILVGTTEEIKSVRKFISSSKYYNKYCTLNILCYLMYLMFLCIIYFHFSAVSSIFVTLSIYNKKKSEQTKLYIIRTK